MWMSRSRAPRSSSTDRSPLGGGGAPMPSHSKLRYLLALAGALSAATLLALGCGAGSLPGTELGSPQSPAADAAAPMAPGAGQVVFRVAWPAAEASARVIPTGTDHLDVTIRPGAGQDAELTDTIDKSEVSGGQVTRAYDLMPGTGKEITIEAVAADGQVAATATVSADVAAAQRTQLALTLESTGLFDPAISGSASPASAEEGSSIDLVGSASDPDGSLTKLEWDADGDGTFESSTTSVGSGDYTVAVTPAVGSYTATFRATDNDGLSSTVDVTYEITAAEDAYEGIVTDVFSGDPLVGALVSVGGLSDTTDASGAYSITGLSADTQRMEVTHGDYLTRSFEVNTAPSGTQDVTALPSSHNTKMMRALYYKPTGGGQYDPGVTRRWPEDNPPTFVIYTKYLNDGDNPRDVAQYSIDHFVDVIENTLPSMTNGCIGGPGSVEIFEGAPEDDSRVAVNTTYPLAYIT
ncbi:MAG: hypothetical protein GF320_16965, partial [Armatimonadia bacterium]|nr:hypothetical protein [Armatimonadia bacterium]